MKALQGQYKKVIDLCRSGEWTCQAKFWTISKSPHKRRAELEEMGYLFEERRCTHGITNSKDFRLIGKPKSTTPTYEVNGMVLIDGKWVEKRLLATQTI